MKGDYIFDIFMFTVVSSLIVCMITVVYIACSSIYMVTKCDIAIKKAQLSTFCKINQC